MPSSPRTPDNEALEAEHAVAPPLGPRFPGEVAAAAGPSSRRVACLVLVAAPDGATQLGRRFELGTIARIGSAADDDVLVPVEGVAAHHALIERRGSVLYLFPSGGPVTLRKGGSAGEVRVHGEIALAHGVQIVLGRSVLEVLDAPTAGALVESYHECIYRVTMVDGMTGAYNLRSLREMLEVEIRRARRDAGDLALVIADVDDFARVNAAHGIQAGDCALRIVASRLLPARRGDEALARSGDDELALVLPGGSIDVARERAESLRRAVEERSIELETGSVRLTISVGVSCLERSDTSADTLIARARARVRDAKREGKNRVVS